MTEKPYIPKGKNIVTKNGCACKNEYKTATGETYKNSCNIDYTTDPWCRVEGKCGFKVSNQKDKWWDYCTATEAPKDPVYGKNYFYQNMKGIAIFNVIFVITIPLLLYRYGFHELLEVYMPNFDLLATAVSFGGGPGNTRIFQELYNSKSENLLGQISTLFINYMSLLGLTYIVARRVNITKSLAKGWGIGFVMLLLTYLVPNEIIQATQHKFADYFFGLKPGQDETIPAYFSVVSVGLGIAAMFILIEKTILENHKKLIDPHVKNLLQLF
jgi:hypothetical protein